MQTGSPPRPAPVAGHRVVVTLGVAVAVALGAAIVLVLRRPAPETRPNLLLITVDTLRADHVSAYGYHVATTPVLEAVAAQGALFEVAYAPMATTGPSHATLFTSLYPARHGVLTNGVAFSCPEPALSEVLAGRGYDTAAFVSSFVLSRRFAWNRGFARFDDAFTRRDASVVTDTWEGVPVEGGALDQRANRATDKAVAWLAGRAPGGRPFFLWVHYFDPHTPYDPPASDLAAIPGNDRDPLHAAIRRYDGEIHFADREVGRLLDFLATRPEGKNLLVVIAGDHGEGLMDHGHVHHGLSLYEEDTRVPLIVRFPHRVKPGVRIGDTVELLDVAPTILDLLDVGTGALPAEGRSLTPLLTGRPGWTGRDVFLQRRTFPPGANDNWFAPPWLPRPAGHPIVGGMFALRSGHWKYIEAPQAGTRELYDLAADPTERRNLAAVRPDVADALHKTITRWLAAVQRGSTPSAPLTDEERARLRSLGYIG